MRLLVCGDVVGRVGREAVKSHVPRLRRELGLDFVVVNGENAAGGFGITDKLCAELYAAGADVITTGNHVWDQRELMGYIGGDVRDDLALVPDMIAGGDDVDAGGVELLADLVGDAEAVRGVLAIGDDKIEREVAA